MKQIPIVNITNAVRTLEAIQLHSSDLQHHLKQTPKSDPLYDDFEKLLKLSERAKSIEISISEESASLIHEISALDAQVGEKLNHLNRMAS